VELKGVRTMKLKEAVWANALAATMGFVYVVCALLVGLFPEVFKAVAISWFHGFDLGKIWTAAPRGNFVLGLVSAVIGAWLVGYLFAWLYNRFNKSK